MELDLKEIFAGGRLEIGFDYTMDLSRYETSAGEYPFRLPVSVKGGVTNRAGVVSIGAEASFSYYTRCDRCLKEICLQVSVPIRNMLVRSVSGEPADDMIVCPDETLDVDELAVTNIILSLPMKHLCRNDCRGLCPVCGKDLNEGDCGCAREE